VPPRPARGDRDAADGSVRSAPIDSWPSPGGWTCRGTPCGRNCGCRAAGSEAALKRSPANRPTSTPVAVTAAYVEFSRRADVATFIRCRLNVLERSGGHPAPASTTNTKVVASARTPPASHTGTQPFLIRAPDRFEAWLCRPHRPPRRKGAWKAPSSTSRTASGTSTARPFCVCRQGVTLLHVRNNALSIFSLTRNRVWTYGYALIRPSSVARRSPRAKE
jgi:hypothetical protein